MSDLSRRKLLTGVAMAPVAAAAVAVSAPAMPAKAAAPVRHERGGQIHRVYHIPARRSIDDPAVQARDIT